MNGGELLDLLVAVRNKQVEPVDAGSRIIGWLSEEKVKTINSLEKAVHDTAKGESDENDSIRVS